VSVARLTGRIESERIVSVKSDVSGTLIDLYVSEGMLVRAGEPIASIRPDHTQSLMRSEADVEVRIRRLAVAEAARNLERQREMYRQGIAPAATLESARDSKSKADQEYALALKRRAILTANMRRGSAAGLFEITSPLTGIALEPEVSAGTFIQGTSGVATDRGGTTLIRIADVARYHVTVDVADVDLSQFARGMPARVHPVGSEATYNGRISRVAVEGAAVDGIPRFAIDVTVDSTSRLPLGMRADVDVITATKPAALVLPSTAIRGNGRESFVIMPDGRTRTVALGIHAEERVEITSGLQEGDRVLLTQSIHNSGQRP
jgi:HlyD family secretion protein